MAIICSGNKYQYDYSDLLDELSKDLERADFNESSTIYIVRKKEVIPELLYRPIARYYYMPFVIGIALLGPKDFTAEEWEVVKPVRAIYLAAFKADEPELHKTTVKKLLNEMEEMRQK